MTRDPGEIATFFDLALSCHYESYLSIWRTFFVPVKDLFPSPLAGGSPEYKIRAFRSLFKVGEKYIDKSNQEIASTVRSVMAFSMLCYSDSEMFNVAFKSNDQAFIEQLCHYIFVVSPAHFSRLDLQPTYIALLFPFLDEKDLSHQPASLLIRAFCAVNLAQMDLTDHLSYFIDDKEKGWKQAQNDVDRLLELGKYPTTAKRIQAFICYKKGKWDQATSLFQDVLKDLPGDEMALVYLAKINYEQKKTEQSLKDLHALLAQKSQLAIRIFVQIQFERINVLKVPEIEEVLALLELLIEEIKKTPAEPTYPVEKRHMMKRLSEYNDYKVKLLEIKIYLHRQEQRGDLALNALLTLTKHYMVLEQFSEFYNEYLSSARAYLTEAYKLFPNGTDELFYVHAQFMQLKLLHRNRDAATLALLDKCLNINPNHLDALVYQLEIYFKHCTTLQAALYSNNNKDKLIKLEQCIIANIKHQVILRQKTVGSKRETLTYIDSKIRLAQTYHVFASLESSLLIKQLATLRKEFAETAMDDHSN
jgi:hypothetical protein